MCILKDIYCIVPQGLGVLLMAGNHSVRKEIPSQEYPGLSWLENDSCLWVLWRLEGTRPMFALCLENNKCDYTKTAIKAMINDPLVPL